MKCAILIGNGSTKIIDVLIPGISEKEALIHVKFCGLCASEHNP